MTLEERMAVASIFDHSELLNGLRFIWAQEEAYWLSKLKDEALSEHKNTDLMVQYAAKADAAARSESVLKEKVGL